MNKEEIFDLFDEFIGKDLNEEERILLNSLVINKYIYSFLSYKWKLDKIILLTGEEFNVYQNPKRKRV